MPCSFVPLVSVLGLYILYKILDRVVRWPRVGRYSERYILVTGCGRGFGFLSCVQLDRLGCHVIAGCRSEMGEAELRKACSARLHIVRLDVSNPESVRKAYETVKSILPPGKGLWGIVNNAGIAGKRGRMEWLSIDDYKAVNAVNLYGLMDTTMVFLPLIKRERGRIVNVTSVGGRVSAPELTAYCISKYGVEAFNDSLRRSLKEFDCHVALVEPSGYRTNITSLESLEKSARDAWDEASKEAKEEFGEEYFKQYLAGVTSLKVSEDPSSFSEVTNAYEDALFSRWPRARYIPGRKAKNILTIVPNLPEWMSDWVIVKTMNRGGNIPPAFLQQQRKKDQ